MDKPRPYITAALLCENLLEEKDGSLTIVRVADRLQYRFEAGELPTGTKPATAIKGLLSLKSGPVTGDHTVKLIAERPSGKRKEVLTFPVKFLGKDQGQNIILNVFLGIEEDGLHWFDVVFDDELLTRIPLMVMPLPEETRKDQKI